MKLISAQSELAGQARMPGSKSHTIRAIAFASLAKGRSVIRSPLDSLDARSAVNCFRAFGAKINTNDNSVWQVEGFSGIPQIPDNVIDVGNSGTSLRLALGTGALLDKGMAVFTGDDQIRRRPAAPLLKSLNELGAVAHSARQNGLAPYIVHGPLTGGRTEIEAISSQYLSSLLVNCPLAAGDTEIVVKLLNEKPYVEMTLAWLDRLGINYQNNDFQTFTIPGRQGYRDFECQVPADFSSATFFLCAAALAGRDVQLIGMDMNDTQGDKAVVDYLKQMGAKIEITGEAIIVNQNQLHGVNLDLNATPDALPAMAVTACFAQGKTRFYNVPQARIKETDRIAVMAAELKKLGAIIKELPDGLEIDYNPLHGGTVDGHGDHRVVMSLALAGLLTAEPVTISGAEAVAVTFPEFANLMQHLGAKMKLVN
ncbi:MAG: 3-phosphoshikimate 1-carboxyvinyltransferase [Phycisphaerae bacterium]